MRVPGGVTEKGPGRRTDNQRNHARAVATSRLKALDQLLHLPYFNLGEKKSVLLQTSLSKYGASAVARVVKMTRGP